MASRLLAFIPALLFSQPSIYGVAWTMAMKMRKGVNVAGSDEGQRGGSFRGFEKQGVRGGEGE